MELALAPLDQFLSPSGGQGSGAPGHREMFGGGELPTRVEADPSCQDQKSGGAGPAYAPCAGGGLKRNLV